ncbi:MAG TPA: hypothetical protein VF432_20550 [Thermoanaerobaculia bacterium]
MRRAFFDPRREDAALRRAAVLLERIRQDGGGETYAELQASIDTMRRAAAAGRMVHRSAIERVTSLLARLEPLSCGRGASVGDLVRCNAIAETRELIQRLAFPRPGAAQYTLV